MLGQNRRIRIRKDMVTKKTKPYFMKKNRSVDIDTEEIST